MIRDVSMQPLEARRLLSAGDLDTSFSGDGFTFVPGGNDTDDLRAVAQQPSGNLVLLSVTGSELHLRRVHADGTLDTQFAGDGNLATGLSSANYGSALAIDPSSGRIALLGQQVGTPVTSLVAVFTADGVYDSGFDFDGRAQHLLGITPSAIAFQPNGKLIIAGATGTPDDGIVLKRLDADGAIDDSFGTGGHAAITDDLLAGTADFYTLKELAVAPDGKILIGADFQQSLAVDHRNASIFRFSASGQRDSGFDGDGRLLVEQADDMPLELRGINVSADGSVQAMTRNIDSTTRETQFRLTSVTPSGTSGNGYNGRLALPSQAYDVRDFDLDPTGKILVTGHFSDSGTSSGPFAARFLTDGLLDLSYANQGIFQATPDYLVNRPVLFQVDGQIVFGGSRVTSLDAAELVLLRLAAGDGPPADCSLNAKGTLIVYGRNLNENASISIRSRDGRMVVRVNDYAISYAPSRVKRMAFFLYGGDDTFTVGPGIKGAYCEGGDGNDTLNGGQGGDVFLGGLGKDRIYGNDGDDILLGGGSNDYLLGGAGKDDLFGQGGRDTLSGAGGNDRLFGGPDDADDVNGGAGTDSAALDDKDTFLAIETFLSL